MKRLLKYIALIPCLAMAFNACDVLDKLPTDKYSEDVTSLPVLNSCHLSNRLGGEAL